MTETEAGTADVAGRWFAIEVEYVPVSRAQKFGWIVAGCLVNFLTLGFYFLPLRQRSTVRLVGRSDGATVAGKSLVTPTVSVELAHVAH